MKIPNRRSKTTASKTVIQLALYIVLMDASETVPVAWLEKAGKSKVCYRRYMKELKELVFGDSLYYEFEDDYDEWDVEEKKCIYRSRWIGVCESYIKSPAYKFDEVVSRGVTPNKKAHIERLKRLITLYDRLGKYPDFDFFDFVYDIFDNEGAYYEDEDNPFPDAQSFLKFVKEDYAGLTLRTMQRDLKDIKDAICLYVKIMNVF